VVIFGVGALAALGNAGINVGPIVAAAGVAGVALGIGGQYVVRDLIAGFALILEDQYRVGDDVELMGVRGRVQAISLRSTKLQAADGSIHTISNGPVAVATNFTKGPSRAVIDLPVAYGQDMDRIVARVKDAAEKMRAEPPYAEEMLGPLNVLGVEDLGTSEATLKAQVDTLPGRQWDVGRELRRRIKLIYDEDEHSEGEEH
jgi:small conductance mechanosensitive channel